MKTKKFEQVIRKSLKEIKQYFKEKDTDESIDENETLILAGRNKKMDDDLVIIKGSTLSLAHIISNTMLDAEFFKDAVMYAISMYFSNNK